MLPVVDTTVDGVISSAPPPVADPLLGSLLDSRYRLDRPIARGGMATVYAATDTRLDRPVAVKVMRPGLASDPDFVERFAREARAAARLSAPEVVAVHDQGTDAATGTAYLVMERVSGGTLRDVLRERGALPPARALDLLEPVLVALAAAHAAGLVHRDVKPENVLLSDDGRVKVADFGLARAIETSTVTATTGLLIGTVAYLAPEQVEHGRTDTRTDVYAAGVLLWELLTGSPPYSSDSPMTVAYRHVHEDVPPPGQVVEGVPAGLDDLVVRATRRDPSARPADAGAFLAELRAVRADLDPRSDDAPVVRRTGSPTLVVPRGELVGSRPLPRRNGPRRRRLLALLAVVVACAVLAGGWYAFLGRWTAAPRVVGMAETEARSALEAAGFTVDERPAVYSDRVAEDHVVDQDPAPDGRVLEGGTITLQTSLGPDRRAVPDLAGRTRDEAAAALEETGLAAGPVTEAFSEAPVGTVVRTDPEKGAALPPDTAVALVLSKGVEMLPVPDAQGAPRAEAEAAVTEAGFTPKVVEVFSEQVDRGRVADQSPSSGTAARGSEVVLEVSKGPELVPVPDVVGQPRDDAEQALEAAGLSVRVVAIPGPGRVRSTDPAAGAQVRKGSRVTVYVF
ncbi:MAG: Probable serine/threonine-protein kinase pknL [uncultured Frankineae bacterium]|uniref:non-specific serine/threonine protein kinase n=1 Tax=uncultured Frankineae bacterium TaxID=437475 RepID=A0A6J4KSP0_9ACTN|nr:MAG: Probable serine/threonine-protein kinase pknL [uncultured Frankineae bacterium]